MTIFGYIRVSTLLQANEGESLGAQQRALEGYCQFKGFVAPIVYIERGVSGSVPFAQRPEGARIMGAIQRGDVLIVPKLDRAFRSALDALDVLGQFTRGGVSLHFLDLGEVTGSENGIGKLVFTILAAVAEAERDRTIERIREVKRDQAARGRFLGGAVPFGFQVGEDGQLEEAPAQQMALLHARRMRAENFPLRKISATLKGMGYEVSHVTLSKVLDKAA